MSVVAAVKESLAPEVPKPEEVPGFFVVKTYPDAFLKKVAQPWMDPIVGHVELQIAITMMEKTMQAYNAVGLAATQVGIGFRILTIVADGKPLTMINPKIKSVSTLEIPLSEGCLSFPGIVLTVRRNDAVEVVFTDRYGLSVTRWFRGLEAREVLHEIDHLDGKTFLDRVPRVHRQGILERMQLMQRKAASFQKKIAELKTPKKRVSKTRKKK